MENTTGLPRALTAGESVILSSGSTATTQRSYPAGYDGEVEILLDGAEERERACDLTLIQNAFDAQTELGDANVAQQQMGESRAPSRELKN